MRKSTPAPRPLARVATLLLVIAALAAALALGCGAKSSPDTSSPAAHDSSVAPAPPPAPDTAHALPAGAVGAVLGESVFKTRCVICHGESGHGDGPASKGLNPKPRNFHDTAYMSSRTDAQLLDTIHKGKGAMPRWEGQLSEEQMRAVLAYVRHFGREP